MVFVSIALQGINKDYVAESIAPDINNPVKNTAISVEEVNTIKATDNINDYAVISQKPLFTLDRKPFTPAPVEETKTIKTQPKAKKKAAETGKLRLNAVILSGDKKIALILDEKNKTLARVHEGENINGWEIKTVESHAAILSKGTNEMLLELEIKPNTAKLKNNSNKNKTNIKDTDNIAPLVELDGNNNKSIKKDDRTSKNDG